jgi:hypothetical protein
MTEYLELGYTDTGHTGVITLVYDIIALWLIKYYPSSLQR